MNICFNVIKSHNRTPQEKFCTNNTPKKELLFGVKQPTSISFEKARKIRQKLTLENLQKAMSQLKKCSKDSPEYSRILMIYNDATKDFLDSYTPVIKYAIKRSTARYKSSSARKISYYKDDLKAEAQIALLNAAKTYRPDRGTTFISYATTQLLWAITRNCFSYIVDTKISQPTVDACKKVIGQLKALEKDVQKLSLEEICTITNCNLSTAKNAKQIGKYMHFNSLDAPLKSSTTTTRKDFLKSYDSETNPVYNTIYSDYLNILKQELEKLSPHHKKVVLAFIADENKTFESVSKKIGMSKQRIDQIVSPFIKHMRTILETGKIPNANPSKK